MKKGLGFDKSIAYVLWIALGALVICVGVTFLHVFDIRYVFEKVMLESYEGHVDTVVNEVAFQVNMIRNMMESYTENVTTLRADQDIADIIREQEMFTNGYDFFYLDSNGALVGSEESKRHAQLYYEISQIPIYSFSDNYTCVPAQSYFDDDMSRNCIMGVKRLEKDNGNIEYLIIRKDLTQVLNLDTFNYLITMGDFAIISGNGSIIAATLNYYDDFDNKENFISSIQAKSADTNKAKKQISNIKKNIYTKISDRTKVDLENGERGLVCYGEVPRTHDMYYMYYFKSGTISNSIRGATTRSFIMCLFMILILLAMIVFIWFTLNESNDVIVNLAYRDEVTGGYNFNYFRMKVGSILQAHNETPFMMLRFDIMNFRYINESYGHDKADIVLGATIREFEKIFDKRKELCVRVNSDQFVALVTNDMGFDDRYLRYLKGITDEANENSIRFPIRLKVGMYQVRKEDKDIDMMIDRANAARKSVDPTTNNLQATYSDNIIKTMRKVDAIESEMEKALRKGEFKVFIQPKWDIVKDEIIGGEALVRWIKNDGSIVYPSDFIPVFESNGFIETLDFYMLEQSCVKLKELTAENGKYKIVPISVNQSRILINNPDYIKNVEKVIKRYDTDVSKIQLEITENLFFDQKDKMIEVINSLKTLGFDMAMDDFGSGYSSLNILKDIPFDILKIDKDFFDEASISNASTVILKKILEMAKELNIDVICEGVETQEQVDMLRGFGCHAVQGYFYGKPIACEEFYETYCLNKK